MPNAKHTCFICEKAIEAERLEVTPNTYLCDEHARKRPCQGSGCSKEVEAERVAHLPETLYCGEHAPVERNCEVCQRPIEYQRREAVPRSGLCEEHAAKALKLGGEF